MKSLSYFQLKKSGTVHEKFGNSVILFDSYRAIQYIIWTPLKCNDVSWLMSTFLPNWKIHYKIISNKLKTEKKQIIVNVTKKGLPKILVPFLILTTTNHIKLQSGRDQ